MKRKLILLMALITVISGALSACGQKADSEGKKEVNIGYFPNLTHIATIIALEKDYFSESFGEEMTINTKTVSNGGLFMEAMETKAIDVGTVGPGPIINFYVKDPKYHIISGAVNGGAVLVSAEHSGVKDIKDLADKKVAIPVIGSTQDVMLRKTLADVNLKPTSSGGNVELFAAAPADTATLFIQKSVDAAATQEPWGYILENQADGSLLLDWDEFAWGKDSTNTVVVASEAFLQEEELVKAYLQAHIKAIKYIEENPKESQDLVIKHIKDLTGKEIAKEELEAAFSRLEVTTAVNEQVIQEMADISVEADYVDSNNIDGLIQLDILNSLQKSE